MEKAKGEKGKVGRFRENATVPNRFGPFLPALGKGPLRTSGKKRPGPFGTRSLNPVVRQEIAIR